MLEMIQEAAKNFCIHQLGLTPDLTDTKPQTEDTLFVSIQITANNDETYHVYLLAQKSFIQLVASLFLEEQESDDETLDDMALECINLIVGNAKVLAAEKDIHFTISTPNIAQLDTSLLESSEFFTLACDNSHLSILLQKDND